MNNKQNQQQAENMQKIKIKQYKDFIYRYMKWDWRIFTFFVFDMLVFFLILLAFFSSETFLTVENGYSNKTTNSCKYFILGASFYVLLKFTITNFFYSAVYYKNIILFDKEIKIKDVKFRFVKKVDYISISFLTLFIVVNIIVAFILNYEADAMFSQQKLIKVSVATLSSLLLIPSFTSALSKIFTVKKSANLNYKALIRDQFLANDDLFKSYEIVNNFEAIKFKKLAIESKKGFFLLTDYPDKTTKDKVLQYNDSIILQYQEIWEKYCEYLRLVNNAQLSRSLKYTNYHIQRIFDTIMIDFLAV